MSSDTPICADDALFERARTLLRTVQLGQWLATRPPSSVVTLPASATCGSALRTLATHSISSAPVFDGAQFWGWLDVADIARALLSLVNVRELTEESKECALRSAGLQLEHQQVRSLSTAQDGALIYRADMSSTLHDVVLYGFLQPNAAGCTHVVHRVGVFDTDDDVTSDDDMSCASDTGLHGISITHVVSQSDVLAFLHKHVDELGALAGATLAQLGLAAKTVVCVPAEMSTIKAFASMVANKVSCVGVISHGQGGGLAGSLSSSDLCGLLPGEHFAAALAAPVLQYLQAKASAGWAGKPHSPLLAQQPQQPLPQQLGQGQQRHAGSAHNWGLKSGEGLKPLQLVTVSPSSTLREVLALLTCHRLHRLHVLDGRQRPVGIVTITDLLRVIVGCSELLEALGTDLEDQEVEQMPAGGMDCDCGMDTGSELIEGRRGLAPVSSQALLTTT